MIFDRLEMHGNKVI